jgi:hypothetical protein
MDMIFHAEIDERDPDVAALIDNVVEGFEIFSRPLSWGARGGAEATRT